MGVVQRGRWSVVLVLLVGAGLPDCKCSCRGDPAATIKVASPASLKPLAVDPEWRKCAAGDTCIHTPSDCCGCANGGNDVAINARFAGEAARARQSACPDPQCGAQRGPDRYCGLKSECVNSTCLLVDVRQTAPAGPAKKFVPHLEMVLEADGGPKVRLPGVVPPAAPAPAPAASGK